MPENDPAIVLRDMIRDVRKDNRAHTVAQLTQHAESFLEIPDDIRASKKRELVAWLWNEIEGTDVVDVDASEDTADAPTDDPAATATASPQSAAPASEVRVTVVGKATQNVVYGPVVYKIVNNKRMQMPKEAASYFRARGVVK